MAREKLKERIIENSINKERELAKDERDVIDIYFDLQSATCLCGQYPIKEICKLENKHNKKVVIVGNDCVKYFFKENYDYLFKDIKKISKDINRAVSEETIHYAIKQGRINQEDDHQYLISIKKRRPFPFQLEWRHKFNKILLEKLVGNRLVT